MELLKELTEACGAPGFEDEIRQIVLRELDGLVDEVKVDKLGNVIAVKRAVTAQTRARQDIDGAALRVMVAGHMDEIGFLVKHIDEKGFLRLNPLGGFDPKTLIAKRVLVRARRQDYLGVIGSKPIHIMTEKERTQMPEIDNLFVDLGLAAATVKRHIEIGDPVTLKQDFLEFGNSVCGKSMDNRIAVWVMLRTLKAIKRRRNRVDLFAAFTTQEEVGLRGAITSAFGIDPDIGVALDVTIACDMPGVPANQHVTKLGEGTAIKICDSSAISNPKLVRHMKNLAERKKIRYQMEILPRGGTDAGGMQRTRAGVPVVTLSVPTRYVHSVVETVNKRDLKATVDLMTAFVMDAHNGNFSYD